MADMRDRNTRMRFRTLIDLQSPLDMKSCEEEWTVRIIGMESKVAFGQASHETSARQAWPL